MITDRQRNGLVVEGNLQGNAVRAGIDDENIEHIIGLFTDLYSDPIMAVVREYPTNARDALIEAGKPDVPIEVTLPTTLSKFFKVHDAGVGLDEDDVRTIYSRYGTSTKRSTNTQVGALGLGCKSALTYIEQFTVTSRKNGVKTVATVSRDGSSVPVFTSQPPVSTTEPNGTTVSIPVRPTDTHAFERAARTLFSYWPKGTVLLNGEEPDRIEGLWLSDSLCVIEGGGEPHRVVMGGVPYPIEQHFAINLNYNYRLVAFVPIGAVSFPPSREALMYDRKTRDTLAQISAGFNGAIQGAVQREVDACPSASEALRAVSKWEGVIGNGRAAIRFTYKGKEVPRSFYLGEVKTTWGTMDKLKFERVPRNTGYYERKGTTNKVGSISASDWPGHIWLVGYTLGKFTPNHRRKIEKWHEVNQRPLPEKGWVLLPDDSKLPKEWIDPDTIIPWDDVNAMKLPAVQNPGSRLNGRLPGAYSCYVDGDFNKSVESNDIDVKKPLYYMVGNRWDGAHYAEALKATVGSFTLAMFPSNRKDKFVRTFPEAVPVRTGLQKAHDDWFAKLPEDAHIALAINDQRVAGELSALDPSKVDDQKLKAAILDASYADLQKVLQQRRLFVNVLGSCSSQQVKWENPLRAYPLYNSRMLNMYTDHTYHYINAAYAAGKEG